MTKIKFCGLKRLCDIAWANELKPDYVGFVFAGKKRRVDEEQARLLRSQLDSFIPAVGVFVDDDPAHIAEIVDAGTIQLVQLHGHENSGYIHSLRRLAAVPLIQAFSIQTKADVQRALQSPADYILLDHGQGGTGEAFDWSLLQDIKRPYFLAGGLTPENAAQAAAFSPFALDVSSGIETDGVKDRKKMIRFMANVRHEEEKDE